jgi:hypothetical protein
MIKRKTLEGVLSVVDYSANDPCSGGPAWATLIDDEELCEHNLEDYEFFKEFVGKKVKITIEVIEDE